MNFWLRNIIIGIVLIAIAAGLLLSGDVLSLLDESIESEAVQVSNIEEPAKKAPPKKKINSDNAAAAGLSRFYENLYGNMDEDGVQIRNNMIFLPDPKGDLIELLEAKRMVTRPLRKTWKGSKASRPFRKGETLFQKLAEFAELDGLDVLWWINKDFIVKDPFRIENNILQTAFTVGTAVAGHFDHGVATYFCYKQRTIVVIENQKNFDAFRYLDDDCRLLQSRDSY